MRPKTLYQKCRASISPQRVDQLELPKQNPFDFIQADRVVGAVMQLGCAPRFVGRDLLRVLIDQPAPSSHHGLSTRGGHTLISSHLEHSPTSFITNPQTPQV
jgi:hypothetical protein